MEVTNKMAEPKREGFCDYFHKLIRNENKIGFMPTKEDIIHVFIQHAFTQQLALILSQACSRSQGKCGQQIDMAPNLLELTF